MRVGLDEVRRIAALARLDLPAERLEELARDLDVILGHVSVLRDADTDGVQPVEGVGAAGAPLARDYGPPFPLQRAPQAFAPRMRDGFFLVPRLPAHADEDAG